MPKRVSTKTGSELFIVDNSDDEWKVIRYLRDWCEISRSIDVATAYFEIGSLLSLDGKWQKVDSIRILMGDEVAQRTAAAFARALDAKLAARMRAELVELVSRQPVTTLLVTHSIDEAIGLADRIILLSPSPARVLSEVRIECPRSVRSPEQIAAIRREIAQKFDFTDG